MLVGEYFHRTASDRTALVGFFRNYPGRLFLDLLG